MQSQPTGEEILDQCLIAFGAGAGTHKVTLDAVRELRQQYLERCSKHADTWEKDAQGVLLNARMLGLLCAIRADRDPGAWINRAQLLEALADLPRIWEPKLLVICPWC